MNLSLIDFMSHLNYGAIIVSVIIFFFLGALWFSALFSEVWTTELRKHNVIIKEPSKIKLISCMGLTFLNHTIIVLSLAYLVYATGSATFMSGLTLGCVAAFGLAATAVGGVFIWESRSLRLFLIDIGYQMIGIISTAVILSLWR